jgi:hypothetical protein
MKLRSNPVTIKAVQSILLQLNYDAIRQYPGKTLYFNRF